MSWQIFRAIAPQQSNTCFDILLTSKLLVTSKVLNLEDFYQNYVVHVLFTPQPLRAVGVLFSPMVSGWAGGHPVGQWEKVCPGCISETIRCRKLILGRDIG